MALLEVQGLSLHQPGGSSVAKQKTPPFTVLVRPCQSQPFPKEKLFLKSCSPVPIAAQLRLLVCRQLSATASPKTNFLPVQSFSLLINISQCSSCSQSFSSVPLKTSGIKILFLFCGFDHFNFAFFNSNTSFTSLYP